MEEEKNLIKKNILGMPYYVKHFDFLISLNITVPSYLLCSRASHISLYFVFINFN